MGRHAHIPRPFEDAVPAVVSPYDARNDDWLTGFCMLRCRRRNLRVRFAGDVGGDGAHMPLYACDDCLQELREMLHYSLLIRDGVYPANALNELNDVLLQRFAA